MQSIRRLDVDLERAMVGMETTQRPQSEPPSSASSPRKAALFLFFLSPVIGELVSGNAPPLVFFDPAHFVFLSIIYGSSALLIRELIVRWGKGWPSLLALGFAYGIVNEGLAAKTFFDPTSKVVDVLLGYGTAFGIHWVWVEQVSTYHAVISIGVPILVSGLLFRDLAREPWLGNRTMMALVVLLMAGVYLIFLSTPYRPPAAPVAMCVLLVLLLYLLASKLPKELKWKTFRVDGSGGAARASRPGGFFGMGFLFSLTLLLLANFLAASKVPALIAMVVTGAVYLTIGLKIVNMSGHGLGGDEGDKLALAAGLMSVFVAFGFVMEFAAGSRGMVIVGTCVVLFFFWMRRRIREDKFQKATDAV